MYPALDLDLVKTFLTVLETQSFKDAALHLNKTPAAVSQQIKRLETQVGGRVLERNNQGLSLTATGKYVQERGQVLLRLNNQFFSELSEGDLKGPLHLGAPADTAPTFLNKMLPIFQREFPKVNPVITMEPSRKLKMRIQSGSLDLAIIAEEGPNPPGIPLWRDEQAWCGKAEMINGSIPVGLMTLDTSLRDHAMADLDRSGLNYHMVFEAFTVAALKQAVEAGFCHALLPRSVSKDIEVSHHLETRKPEGILFTLQTGPRFDPDKSRILAEQFKAHLTY